MAITGKTPKFKTMKQQRLDGELGLIIDEFGRAMWSADRAYVAKRPHCRHDPFVNFTPNMHAAWLKFVEFCMRNPE